MKRTTLNGKTGKHTMIRLGCATACCVLWPQAFAKDGMAKQDEPAAEESPANWVNFTFGYASVSGRDATFQSRARQNDDFYGGLSSLRWEKEMDDLTFLIEGHALFGMEDYDITLGVTKKDVGYVKGGFRQFRTWYDSTGGYVPGIAGGWIPLYGDDELSVDRGELWFEAGLRKEHVPEITFGYSHEWRDGTKDSTSWGQSVPLGPSGWNYGIVPSLNNIDERRDTFRLDITHTLGNTDLGLGLRYESVRNDDTLTIHQQPGAEFAWDDLTSKQRNVYDSDLFSAHIFSETRINDRMLMSFGYFHTTMDTDTSGSSRIVVDRDGTRSYNDHAFDTLSGGGQLSLNVANANFWWNPIDNLVIVPSFRAEWEDTSASSDFFNGEHIRDSSDSETNQLTEQLEVLYTGWENLELYSKVELSQANGDISYHNINYDADNSSFHFQSSDITQEKYMVGANWYPLHGLSVAAQYYHKNFNEDYDNSYQYDPSKWTDFDADLKNYNYSTDDANLRLTWRALPNLTLVSRYDYQRTTMENRAYTFNPGDDPQVITNLAQSAEITRHIFSQSVNWLPLSQAYVQGTISYVLADTDTPANKYAPQRLADSNNDYVTANVTVGYALDQKTDIRVSYTYYSSSDFDIPYESPGVPGSVPYGTDLEEHVFSLSLNRRISPRMIWNMGYGYFTSNEGTTGGHSDFSAHMVSTGLQVRF
jgi:hypothetical protein